MKALSGANAKRFLARSGGEMSAIPPSSAGFLPVAKPVKTERAAATRPSEDDTRPSRWEWTYRGWERASSDDDFMLG